MGEGNTILETSRLKIGYSSRKRKESVVAENLSLSLRSGELVCLLGPNGAGKSTLIRSLAGLEEPLGGLIKLNGRDIRFMSPKEKARLTSVVLTDPAPVGMFTAHSLVALGRHPHTRWTGSLREEDRKRIDWALQVVGAEELATRQVGELSDGERQKVMIARALAQEASILILDEPTAFVDLPRRVELMRILGDLAGGVGIAVLLSSHDLELSLRCADKLWIMNSVGEIEVGAPEDLALGGKIASVFASDKIGWDAEQGGFRLRRETARFARVEGDGDVGLWTRRALTRMGYVVRSDGDESVSISFEKRDGHVVWNVTFAEGEKRFRSLDALCAWDREHRVDEAALMDSQK